MGNAEDTRDAVQEILARALVAIADGRVREAAALPAFVYGIARHVSADVLRARQRVGLTADVETVLSPDPSPLDVLIRDEERRAVARALRRLDAADRELLHSCFVVGERIATLARRSGVPADRLRQRKSRALRRLRELLGARHAEGHISDPIAKIEV